jgi:transposase
MEMTINYGLINSIEDLYDLSNAIMKGLINMPNISKLSRQIGADRKTVRKALKGIKPSKTRSRSKYLDGYRDVVVELLNDEYREFDYIKHLYNYLLREHKVQCSYSALNRYINNDEELLKMFRKSNRADRFTERFETEAGVQAQFDLKERVPVINTYGEKDRVNVATLTLGYSIYNVRRIVPDTSYETVISFLAEAFDEIGGVTKELVIDNIKCLVDKPRRNGNKAILNVKFEEFLKDYQLEVFPCIPGRPQTKGKTETQNKVPSQLKNYNGTYKDLHEVSDILKVINGEDNESISQATNLPPLFLLKKEQGRFKKLPPISVREKYYLKLKEVHVSNESLISYKSNKYSVPKQYIGKYVGRVAKNNKLLIYYNNELITIHEVSNKKLNIKKSHNLMYEKRLTKLTENNNESLNMLEEMENISYDNI